MFCTKDCEMESYNAVWLGFFFFFSYFISDKVRSIVKLVILIFGMETFYSFFEKGKLFTLMIDNSCLAFIFFFLIGKSTKIY